MHDNYLSKEDAELAKILCEHPNLMKEEAIGMKMLHDIKSMPEPVGVMKDDSLFELLLELDESVERTAMNTKRTADEVESLRNELYVLDKALEVERNDRRKSEAEAMRYTKKADKINKAIAILALIVGAIGVIHSFFFA